MKINTNSITFKTLLILFISSFIFVTFLIFTTQYSFSKGYKALIQEDISSIEESISSPLALNLSYGFNDAITEIATDQLKNKKIIFLKISSEMLDNDLIFSNENKTISELKEENHFISTTKLIDPGTSVEIGDVTLVYSNKSYKTYMKTFYRWFAIGIFILIFSMIFLGFILYRSLNRLTILSSLFKEFNPNKPANFNLENSSKDEIGTITASANIMVKKLITYITYNKELNLNLSQKESHLKDAQRIAKVGSWEYDIVNETLSLSDEIYRILEVKLGTIINWTDFLSYISREDHTRIINILDNAIKNGSRFNMKYRLNLKNKKNIHVQTKGKVRKKQNGQSKITAVTMDITTEIENKKTIEKLAYYDTLTGLANRTLLNDRMNKAIQNAKRTKSNLAIIFLDLDHFKLINDTLGHNIGDDLLIYISKILQTQIRESDTLARLGGDEFIILLPSIHSDQDVANIASKILHVLQNKHDIGSHQLFLTSSMGIALYPQHAKDVDELVRNADTAMYKAKNNGRNSYKIYCESMGNYVDNQLHLEQDLIQAVKNKTEIEVFYQPKIDTTNNFISGAEALVRWRHPTRGLIFPDDFIFIAESTGLMIELGYLIIEKSISQIQEWNQLGLAGLRIAINLSPRQFQDSNLTLFISSILEKYQVNPSQVEFEITESLSMSSMANTLHILENLKDIGVSIAIDDFGTGHSSLAYLKKFPINILKIDKSFIMGIIDNEEDKIIVQTIISMAHSLGFKTVAEGVETIQHVNMLKDMKCDQLQGYYFAKPIPKNEFVLFLQNYIPN